MQIVSQGWSAFTCAKKTWGKLGEKRYIGFNLSQSGINNGNVISNYFNEILENCLYILFNDLDKEMIKLELTV